MLEPFDVPGGGYGAFLETIVGNVVHNDVILRFNKRIQDAETPHPASRVY